MKVSILYYQLFDKNGENQTVGGVQTYILNLARVFHGMGIETTIYQWANLSFEKNVDGLKVKGVPVFHLPYKKRKEVLFQYATREIDAGKDILIFGADHISVPTKNPRHISIQHGVSWDLPAKYLTNRKIVKYELLSKIIKLHSIRLFKKCFENCQNTVCVDYNFLNWYRTTVTNEPDRHHTWVIPNFAAILPFDQVKNRNYENKDIRILFARRFVQIRGVRIIAEAAKQLLKKYHEISFTFAGEGPEESWLHEMFSSENRIKFIKYMPGETLRVHLEHDIAVVPSIGSEGTSLSVAEAMATGCPVVATAVGGVTNMIIDRYNGILVMPNTISLLKGIEYLIQDPILRSSIGTRAYETAKEGFSFNKWKNSWQNVLMEISNY